jgi:PUA-domain protein
MPKTLKRHFLKEKETENILQELSQKLNVDAKQVLGSKPRIELAESQSTQIFIANGKPILARLNNILSPTLVFKEIFPFLPKIIVDMGAIPHICSGADVMAPGIVRIHRDFNENDILLIADERHEKPLAIGISLFDVQHMRKQKRGKVVKNVHYVGDKLWNLLKKML